MAKHPRKPTPHPGIMVPMGEWEDSQPTPVPVDIDEIVRRLWPLRDAGNLLIELQTKVEHLEDHRDGTTQKIAINAVEKDIRSLAADIVDIKGVSGNNGKIGNVRADLAEVKARIDKQEARRWTLIVTAVGMILTAASLAVAGGRWVGKLENRVEQLEKYNPTGSK